MKKAVTDIVFAFSAGIIFMSSGYVKIPSLGMIALIVAWGAYYHFHDKYYTFKG